MTFIHGIEKYKIIILAICISLPLIIIINETRKQINLNKIYNFRKELKNIKKNKIRIKKETDTTDKTLIGKTSGNKEVYTHDHMKNMFICGTTGAGKTVVLSNYIKTAIEKDYPLLIVDGKGDIGKDSLLDIILQLNNKKKLYVINLSNPNESDNYNPFHDANPTMAKDMLINLTDWSEEHYKLNTERYLQRLISLLALADIPLSFSKILRYMPSQSFLALSANLLKINKISKAQHMSNAELIETSGKIADNATARFSNLYESELGKIFSDDGINIYTALKENAIILFVLNPLLYPEISPLMGRLVLIDCKQAVSRLYTDNTSRSFFLFDEINVYACHNFLDLINKCRSADITCILAAQSLSDLDTAVSESFKEQVIENCNNYIVMRQNSSKNAENWANVLGTKQTMQVTYQLQQSGYNTAETGFGSAKRVREFHYHPDDIKILGTGQAIYMSKDSNFHCKLKINKPF